MNDTNRALNRVLLLVVGIVLLALGAAAVASFAWPPVADTWTTGTGAARTWLEQAVTATTISGALNWVGIGALALMLILVVCLIILLARLGGGRSRTVLRSVGQENPLGRVTIRDTFVSDALQHSLGRRSEILSSAVTAHDVRSEPVMQINVTPRQNTSPRQVVEDVDELVTNLAALTGRDVPTYISIRSGLRAKLAADQRRVT